MTKTIQVLGIGNAIVDIIAMVSEAFLAEYGGTKSSMSLISAEQASLLYGQTPQAEEHSGGSAANTMAGLAGLGGGGAFVGKVKNDQLGAIFRHDIVAAGVTFETAPSNEGPDTASSIVLVTPDGERTMHTHLGACVNLTEADIAPDMVRAAEVLYIEGYVWDLESSKKAIMKAISIAKDSNTQVALTLSDSFCVRRFREEFLTLISDHADMVFANVDELAALYPGVTQADALALLRARVPIAAITRGNKGAMVLAGDETLITPAETVTVVDTTGAGDLFAAGFLYGYTNGRSLSTASAIGCAAAAKTISALGARPSASDLEMVAARF